MNFVLMYNASTMTNLLKAQRRVRKLLYLMESQDFLRAAGVPVPPAVNTLLPKNESEEPFFVVYDIDWSKYGR